MTWLKNLKCHPYFFFNCNMQTVGTTLALMALCMPK